MVAGGAFEGTEGLQTYLVGEIHHEIIARNVDGWLYPGFIHHPRAGAFGQKAATTPHLNLAAQGLDQNAIAMILRAAILWPGTVGAGTVGGRRNMCVHSGRSSCPPDAERSVEPRMQR